MATTEERLYQWVLFVDDLLRAAPAGLPVAEIRAQLWETFDAEPSWNCLSCDGSSMFELMHPIEGWPPPWWQEAWQEDKQHNPLARWYDATSDLGPQSRERVPSSIATPADHGSVVSQLAPVGLDQQLAIPYHLSPVSMKMFLLGRADRDFSEDDLDLARRVQPLIWLLDRQVAVLAETTTPAAAPVLTGRELAVLGLLSQGCTADAIGRRLACSPRTVHKHLEHLYRKLDVRDRLMAVQRGRELGLLTTPVVTVA
jgi:DNA-binding CsgD family transcriptional regulator